MPKNKNKKTAKVMTQARMINVFGAAQTINDIHSNRLDFNTILDELIRQTDKITEDGSLKSVERMLITQAKTLDILFNRMISVAMQNTEYLNKVQVVMDIGLKAQKQCRQTLVALVDLKYPRNATFIKQQNMAVNQQVNNSAIQEKNLENSSNELLSEYHHETLDTGRALRSSEANSQMEALEACKRPENT